MNSKALKSLRKFVCLNQKQTIRYNYLISEHHKDLKEYFIHWKMKDNGNLEELTNKYNSFVFNSFSSLLDILEMNNEPIFDIFKSLNNETMPRISIKVIQDDSVVNLFSSAKNMNIFNLSKIIENTGFDEILNKNKLIFLENNLPERFKNNQYKNPRLKTTAYKNFIENKIKWKDCWKEDDKNPVEYYSSTLIVPMSMRNDENDIENKEYFDHFFKKVKQYKDSRTIWGFLCFDSINTNYFENKKNPDLYTDLGYIIADQISLYLIFFYNYTSGSKTTMEIRNIIYK